MARFRNQQRFARKIANYSWAGFEFGPQAVEGSTKVILGSFTSSGIDETVVRVRGLITCASDQFAAIEQPVAAVGMAIVSDDAFVAGIGSLPGPVTDISTDHWMMWQAVGSHATSNTASMQLGIFQVDNKAQRVIHKGSRLVVMAEGMDGAASQGVIISGYFRALGKVRA